MPSPRTTSLINAIAAFWLYGGWAVYANFEYGQKVGLTAGLIQGVYAFCSTLSITLIALWVYRRCHNRSVGLVAGFSVSFMVMLIIPWAVHSVTGTPNILQTVLPGIIWGSVYLAFILYLQTRTPPSPNS